MSSGAFLAVLGGNAMACPAIRHLRQLGYRPLVLDRDPNVPGAKEAEHFLAVNFADTQATRDALSGVRLSGIMALNDFGVRTAAVVAQSLGLPGLGLAAAENTCNKAAMKRAWMKAALPTAKAAWFNARDILASGVLDWDTYPCVVKPAFSGGGSRGVFLANDAPEVLRGVESTLGVYIDAEMIIEELVTDSTEHTVEVLVRDGRTQVISISDKHNYPGNLSIVQRLYFPGPRGWRYAERIRPLMQAACNALEIENGCAHFEILIRQGQTGQEDILLLEVGGRPGGGLNFLPICKLSTGFDYPKELARILCAKEGQACAEEPAVQLGWHFFEPAPSGEIFVDAPALHALETHPAVVHAQCLYVAGQPVPEMLDDLKRPGYVLVQGQDLDEVDALMSQCIDLVRFSTRPGQPSEGGRP